MIKNIFSVFLKSVIIALTNIDNNLNDKVQKIPKSNNDVSLFAEDIFIKRNETFVKSLVNKEEDLTNNLLVSSQQLSLKKMIADCKNTEQYFTRGNPNYIFQ